MIALHQAYPSSAITIDIDKRLTPCQFLEYAADCRFILETTGLDRWVATPLPIVEDSRRGHHVTLNLVDGISPTVHIAIQLFLGSDRKREAYNWRRMEQGKFRSYFFQAKFTKESSFVNEPNKMFEQIWENVFTMSKEEFEKKYKTFQQEKHEQEKRKEQKNNGRSLERKRTKTIHLA